MPLLQKNSIGRIELKYRINYFHYLKIRNAIIPYMKRDQFTLKNAGKSYLVRSLYYDTYDYRAYHEKMSGDCDRVKLRLRSYNKVLDEGAVIKAELKVRKANIVEKHSAIINAEQYNHFIRKRCWLKTDDSILGEFERYVHMKDLSPKVFVEYEREGYVSRQKDDLRITFDQNVRSAQASDLFPAHLFFREHHNHYVIMEIKFRDKLPSWLRMLAQSHGLKVIANSKFTQGIQVARNDLYHPDGVVVVR